MWLMVIFDNYFIYIFTSNAFYAKTSQLFIISISIIIFSNQFNEFLLSVERRVYVGGDSTNLNLIQPI